MVVVLIVVVTVLAQDCGSNKEIQEERNQEKGEINYEIDLINQAEIAQQHLNEGEYSEAIIWAENILDEMDREGVDNKDLEDDFERIIEESKRHATDSCIFDIEDMNSTSYLDNSVRKLIVSDNDVPYHISYIYHHIFKVGKEKDIFPFISIITINNDSLALVALENPDNQGYMENLENNNPILRNNEWVDPSLIPSYGFNIEGNDIKIWFNRAEKEENYFTELRFKVGFN